MVAEVIINKIERIEHTERKIFSMLVLTFIIMLFLYVFLVYKAAINGSNKELIEGQITSINSEVNSLDFKYLKMKNDITEGVAKTKGFVSIAGAEFAFIRDTKTSLSLSGN